MHGCNGLSDSLRAGTTKDNWVERLTSWGYVVLVVDSFTPPGIKHACTAPGPGRAADAYGAQAFLAQQGSVDPNRIAVVGFSAGGMATLAAIEARDEPLLENERPFKAAIAFYPICTESPVAVPTLILIGELDDWTPAVLCRRFMAAQTKEAGSRVRLVVYPGAHHGFDIASLGSGRESFGHWLEYNAAAAEQATREVRRFLSEMLGN